MGLAGFELVPGPNDDQPRVPRGVPGDGAREREVARYRWTRAMAGDPVVVVLEPDELPILMERGAPTASGWAVVALAKVYKDGTPAGALVELTIQRDGSSVLTYDEIRRFSPLLPGETPPDDFSPG
jgi:hypothetical protein